MSELKLPTENIIRGRTYFVFRYQYLNMKRPKWDAVNTKYGIDSLPPTVLACPGVLRIKAKNKKEAMKLAKLTRKSDAIDEVA
jgi:hypothetical protein